ncbi:histidine kinase [Actinotalea ferrariae CF5-4]|uniref:Histidine kinase n=1 Tax=Actinotalea ferrariae CF5-4 TaxID=948458 RepID=A0A021VM04_9CELL|nr:SpoIIE family protein phosphatase [Actinotalea ferrariae]EYR62201.1 histidine kinase [Actinotalea ferrariae CF5-4]
MEDALRLLERLAMEAAGIGFYDWDLTTGRLTWDAHLLALFGYTDETFDGTIEAFDARVHPHDRVRVRETLDAAVATAGEWGAEYRIVLPGGAVRWVTARGRAIADPDGRTTHVLGAAFDTTAHVEADARVVRVLESMPSAFFALDDDLRFTYVNAEAEKVLGHARAELLGGSVLDLFPAELTSRFESEYRTAVATGRPVAFEAHYPAPLDGWFEIRAWPGPDGLSVYFVDVTERHRQQDGLARAARQAQLVADVTAALVETLDAEVAVGRLAQLCVPSLADWCIVTLTDDQEEALDRRHLRDVGCWHVDPALRAAVESYTAHRLQALGQESFVDRVIATRTAQPVPEPAHRTIAALLADGEAKDMLAVLRPEHAVLLPLRARGRIVGILSLFRDADHGPFTPEDLTTAWEVAGRAGLALDNARLYRQQRLLAEALQRSMLTDPPEPDHVEIAVRYEPAAEAAQIGGDWYDAFLQRDGGTVVVIGDVVGHDMAAAASMGQLRSLLRGIGVATGAGPADLLREVDEAMRTLQTPTVATALVARIEQTVAEREAGVCRVRWSSAGHLPPLLVDRDGIVAALGGERSDLLLGVDADALRREWLITVERGATLLLHTDGLVERRGTDLLERLQELQDTLGELAGLPLEELCDALLARLLPGHPEDDVALVGVRLHPQDRARPAEAGPNRVPPDVPDDPAT